MATRTTHCDREQLERLLDGQLDDHAQTLAAAHVELCDECREQMESFAAGKQWWQEMRQALSDDDLLDREALLKDQHDAVASIPLDFLARSDNPAMLGRIGEFEILELIGCGGMGIVLKGYDHELNRYVAVKVLHPHCAISAAARRRFTREAQAAAAVVHQHVVAIHAVGVNHHPPYLVMPYVPGESLQQRLNRQGPFEVVDVLRIGQQVAEGLAAAHAQGLVHRDIKPGNILLERNVERVLLTDFGLARAADDASLTHSGVIAGTPQFMSPEQARGDNVDHRTDLFSLGTVLYTLLAGHSPFRAGTAMGVLRRVCDDVPRPLRVSNPTVPDWLDALIAKLHAKEPAGRFASANDVAHLLKQCLAHVQHPTLIPVPDEVRRLTRHNRKPIGISRTLIVAAGCVVVILIGILAYDLFMATDIDQQLLQVATDEPVPVATSTSNQIPISTNADNVWNEEDAGEGNRIRREIEQMETEGENEF